MSAPKKNPFTPTFGIVPPFLAGRDALLASFGEAFENGVGDPNLCTLLIGPRGSGKTALLSCIGDRAGTTFDFEIPLMREYLESVREES